MSVSPQTQQATHRSEGERAANAPDAVVSAGAVDGAGATSPPPARHTPLRLRDVRAYFRLVNEVRELGADPEEWRPHMVRRLRRLMHASVVVSSEVHYRRVAPAGDGPEVVPAGLTVLGDATGAGASETAGGTAGESADQTVGGPRTARGRDGQSASPPDGAMRVIDIGWVCDPEGKVHRIHAEQDDASPEMFWVTPGRRDGAADALVPVKPARKVYGGTTFILSQVALPHVGAVDQLGLHREWGDHPFTPAEHRLVRLFHVELARLWKRDVLRRAGEPNSALPPRLAQTLEELRAGASEKEIARRLELSRHTVHNYVKALHSRFDVSNRAELLAKAVPTRPEVGPRLSLTFPTGQAPPRQC